MAGPEVLAKRNPDVGTAELSRADPSGELLLVASRNETVPVGSTAPPAQTVAFRE
jgi:hypothetical protein